jgi:hypothetical protein
MSQILTSVSFLLSSLAICDETPVSLSRYSFLIYNASVHYWNIVRPLLRDGTRAPLLESISRVVATLEKMTSVHATLLEVDAEWLGQYYWSALHSSVCVFAFLLIPEHVSSTKDVEM